MVKNEMIELVARAIRDTVHERMMEVGSSKTWREAARAAIEAMRRSEPTQKMIEAARLADPLACDVDEADQAEVYGAIWQAMIDALSEEQA